MASVLSSGILDDEKTLRLAPRDRWVLETYGRAARYLGFPELAIPASRIDRAGTGTLLADAYNESGDRDGARRWIDKSLEENPYELRALQRRKRVWLSGRR